MPPSSCAMRGHDAGAAADGLADEWLAAFARRDFERLEALLDPTVRFRALIPRGLREATDPAAAVALIRGWFGDCDVFVVRSAVVDTIADRVRVQYRIDAHEEGAWWAVDQTLYGAPGEAGFAAVDLLCSGFRRVDRPLDLQEPTRPA